MDLAAEAFLAPLGAEPRTADSYVVRREGWYQVVTPSIPDPARNEVMLSTVRDDRDIDALIDEVWLGYTRIGTAFKWCTGPLTTPSHTGERLVDRGFSHWNVRGMSCATSLSIAVPEDVYVTAIPQRDRTRFEARIDGIAAGSAALVDKERVSYLAAAQVEPGYRGRGVYRALLAARLALAAHPVVVTQAREHTSAPILEHLGFDTVYRGVIYQSPLP